jgi:hypothetical protein
VGDRQLPARGGTGTGSWATLGGGERRGWVLLQVFPQHRPADLAMPTLQLLLARPLQLSTGMPASPNADSVSPGSGHLPACCGLQAIIRLIAAPAAYSVLACRDPGSGTGGVTEGPELPDQAHTRVVCSSVCDYCSAV